MPPTKSKSQNDPNQLGTRGRSVRRVRSSSGVADWASVDPVLLLRALAAISVNGGAVRLGYTSDGGAYAIGVYGDGDPYTDYVKPSDDIDEYLKLLADAWSS